MAVGTIAMIAAGASVVGTGYSIYSGEKAASAQARAQDAAVKRANAASVKQQQDFNRVNKKRPNAQGALANARMAAKGGNSGTMLTSSSTTPQAGQLSKPTLLGA